MTATGPDGAATLAVTRVFEQLVTWQTRVHAEHLDEPTRLQLGLDAANTVVGYASSPDQPGGVDLDLVVDLVGASAFITAGEITAATRPGHLMQIATSTLTVQTRTPDGPERFWTLDLRAIGEAPPSAICTLRVLTAAMNDDPSACTDLLAVHLRQHSISGLMEVLADLAELTAVLLAGRTAGVCGE